MVSLPPSTVQMKYYNWITLHGEGSTTNTSKITPLLFSPQMFSDLDERILKASFQEKILKANKKWMKEYLKLTKKIFWTASRICPKFGLPMNRNPDFLWT